MIPQLCKAPSKKWNATYVVYFDQQTHACACVCMVEKVKIHQLCYFLSNHSVSHQVVRLFLSNTDGADGAKSATSIIPKITLFFFECSKGCRCRVAFLNPSISKQSSLNISQTICQTDRLTSCQTIQKRTSWAASRHYTHCTMLPPKPGKR